MRSASLALLVLALLSVAGLPVRPAGGTELSPVLEAALPPDEFADRWQRDGEAWVYPGERLYEHINGGAEFHLELGFVASLVQRYGDGPHGITIEVFEMRDPAAAVGLFQRRYAGGARLPGLPFRHAADPYGIQLLLGPAVITIASGRGEPELFVPMVEMARHLAAGLPRGDHAAVFATLPAADRVAGSERVIRGPLTLRDVAPFADGDLLSLEGETTAVSGEYRSDLGQRTLIVTEYADDQAAAGALADLTAALAPGGVPPESAGRMLDVDEYTRVRASVDGRRLTLSIEEDEPDDRTR